MSNARNDACRRNALEYADHGRERRAEPYDHRPDLAHVWPEAACHRIVIEKVRDVVGLYMNPPTNAAVLSFDEKSQIQLDD